LEYVQKEVAAMKKWSQSLREEDKKIYLQHLETDAGNNGESSIVIGFPDTPMISSLLITRMSSMDINALNKFISAMVEHPIVNINCQSPEEVRDALQLLQNWVANKKWSNDTMTPKYIVDQIGNGFTGLAWD
jgi:hypothetical protein